MRVGYSLVAFLGVAVLCFVFVAAWSVAAQEVAKPTEKQAEKKAEAGKSAGEEKKSEKVELPFQIQLLETRVRFEANGDSRKEVHTIVKINNILGAREFARLAFDYNREWQQVEIPVVRVSHANGGTSELLPSAVTDAVNPAVDKFPAYQDVRVKSARILGLQEGDTIEYRVITTTTKPPLAPEFWLEHTFDRSGQVLEENYELDLPTARKVQIVISSANAPTNKQESGEGEATRTVYRWSLTAPAADKETAAAHTEADVAVSSYASWEALAMQLSETRLQPDEVSDSVRTKANQIVTGLKQFNNGEDDRRFEFLYEFVAQKIQNVELPLTAVGFQARHAEEVLKTGYGTALDKYVLLRALVKSSEGRDYALFVGDDPDLSGRVPDPGLLSNVIQELQFEPHYWPDKEGHGTACGDCDASAWLDPMLAVAPFGMIPANLRGREALFPKTDKDFRNNNLWRKIPDKLPFPSKQSVIVNASLSREGTLTSAVKYVMRGDNELLLREAFHGTAKEKWKDVANLLAISDGFRGEISSVNVSDPLATREPFKAEYTITQAKFVDWSKKPVRIPALLPQIGLPDLPRKAAEGNAAPKIELGTPLDVETQMTLKLPAGTKAVVPAGTEVNRDYARFASKYGVVANTVTASRHVYFRLQEIEGTRGMDYNAFVRAVQNDQAGLIVLEREAENAAATK
jgi:hypothetical protein